jgi:hypothetical protein
MENAIKLSLHSIFLFLIASGIHLEAVEQKDLPTHYSMSQSASSQEHLNWKISKVCFLKNHTYQLDSFQQFIFMDIEITGEALRIDFDDFEATLLEADDQQKDSWAYDIIFLDRDGKKVKSSNLNNNATYLHIGVIIPATRNTKKIKLEYWDSLPHDKFLAIQDTYCEIQ